MESLKFLITDPDFMAKKLKNWKCSKCGSTEEPLIITNDSEGEEKMQMYIKCKKCNTILSISEF